MGKLFDGLDVAVTVVSKGLKREYLQKYFNYLRETDLGKEFINKLLGKTEIKYSDFKKYLVILYTYHKLFTIRGDVIKLNMMVSGKD